MIEQGQVAYAARFHGENPRHFDPWDKLELDVKAIWARVERNSTAAAEAEIARLTAAVARAEAERDEARDGWERWKGLHAGANTVIRQLEREASDLRDRVKVLEGEKVRLRIAFHDATRRPLGVTPDSGAEFYDQRMADEAEERRPTAGRTA